MHFLERLTGGASVSAPLPLIVALHGRGGRPEGVARLFASFAGRARVILPYGFDVSGDGFAWFADPTDDRSFADGTRRAADRLAAVIAEIARRRPTVGKPIVTGFSQGGILSFALAVLHPDLVGAALPVAGVLPRPLWPSAWPAGVAKPSVHAFHGTADEVLSIEGARATLKRLREVGLPVELTEYPGAEHRLTGEMQRDVAQALERAAHPR